MARRAGGRPAASASRSTRFSASRVTRAARRVTTRRSSLIRSSFAAKCQSSSEGATPARSAISVSGTSTRPCCSRIRWAACRIRSRGASGTGRGENRMSLPPDAPRSVAAPGPAPGGIGGVATGLSAVGIAP